MQQRGDEWDWAGVQEWRGQEYLWAIARPLLGQTEWLHGSMDVHIKASAIKRSGQIILLHYNTHMQLYY